MRPWILLVAGFVSLAAHAAEPSGESTPLAGVLAGAHDPAVPTPRDVLGFVPGERAARHADVIRYAEALDAASPRVQLERYGRTHEGRDLLLIIVSSEGNLARLEQIRAGVGRLADARAKLSAGDVSALARSLPAVAFMAYSIHGDEFSGVDAAVNLAWHLATSESDDVRRLREELVVLIDPMQNPDGRERVLSMNSAFAGVIPNPDPESMSHQGTWPWGRTNHYLSDLNRDWFALVHPETRGRVEVLRRWKPQLVVDAHEMGSESTYLFNPPRAPFNPYLPEATRRWWDLFSSDHARAFDRHGWSYFSGEWNEEFYPGYGSSLPLYGGAVAILYEQAGTDAQPVRKVHGAIVQYADSVARQLTSSLANLETAARHRVELLTSFRAARVEAVRRGAEGAAGAYYFERRPDAGHADRLAERLTTLGIEVERATAPVALAAARELFDGTARKVTLPAGSYRVRLDQPQGLLAATVLQPHVPMPTSFLAEEREYLERQKGSRVYDTTAWSPLLASGLRAWWVARPDAGRWRLAEDFEGAAGGILDGDAGYGHVWNGDSEAALALAAELAAEGYQVRCGEKPFRMAGHDMPRGSFLVRAEENPPALRDRLAKAAAARGVPVVPTASARGTGGPDLGGDHWPLLAPARIGIVAGSTTDPYSVGTAWHLLERELGLRVSLLDVGRIDSIDLARYNVLVLPDAWGGGSALERALGEDGLTELRRWVEGGGTLVAIAAGAELAATESSQLSQARLRRDVLADFPPPRLGLSDDVVRALERPQGIGLGPDAKAVGRAGRWTEARWPMELGLPGPGEPLVGPGAAAVTGQAVRSPARSPSDTKDDSKDAASSDADDEDALRRADERLRRFLPSGAIVRVELDPDHWLSHGVGDEAAVMARQEEQLIARDPVASVGVFASPERLHLGGLLWPEAAGRMSRTAWLTRESKGRGQVILFESDPNFRGYFWGSQRCFLDAVLLGPGLGASRTIPW